MVEYIIKKDESRQRIDKFLQKKFPNLPQTLMYKYIRKKRVKINGKKCAVSDFVKENDVLSLYISDEFLSLKTKDNSFLTADNDLQVIYENQDIFILYKPQEVAMHDGENSLLHKMLLYLYNKNEYDPEQLVTFTPSFCNRLDTNTSGLVLAGKTALGVRSLNELIRENKVLKKYKCLVKNRFQLEEGVYTAYLQKSEDNLVVVQDTPFERAKEIQTQIHIDKLYDDFTLLDITLLTGRKHQIRAHLSHLGYPVVGDNKYGKMSLNKHFGVFTQCLQAYALHFSFDTEKYPHLDEINNQTFLSGHLTKFHAQVQEILHETEKI